MINDMAVVFGVAGAIIVAFKELKGFYLWILSDVLFIYHFGNSPISYMFLLYGIISMFSIYKWKQKEAK